MPDTTRWVVIRSAHVVKEFDHATSGYAYTRCGRVVDGVDRPVFDSMPAGRTCETCLRLLVKGQGQ